MTQTRQIDDVLEVRPDWSTYVAGLKARAVVLSLIVLFGVGRLVLSFDGIGRLYAVLGLLAVAGAALGGVAVYVHSSVLRVLPDVVVLHTIFGERVVERDARLTGLLVPVTRPLQPGQSFLVLTGGPGVVRIRVNDSLWDREDLMRVAEAVGVPVESNARDWVAVEAQVPGASRLPDRRPWLFGLGFGVGVIALVVVGVYAYFRLAHLPPYDQAPPKGVSAGTVREQDATRAGVQRIVGGPWRAPRTDVYACTGGPEDRKGWKRSTSSLVEKPPHPGAPAVEQVRTFLAGRGFVALDPHDNDGVVVMSGVTDGPIAGPNATVEVQVGTDYASVDVTGPCETKGNR